MNRADRIAQLCVDLRALASSDSSTKVAVMVETSEDEALMLGTSDAYLRFAAEILESIGSCLDGDGRSVDLGVVRVPFVPFGNSMDPDAHVVVRSVGVAKSDDENRLAVEKFAML